MKRWLAGLLCAAASVAAPAQEKVVQTLEHDGVGRVVISWGGIFEVSVKAIPAPPCGSRFSAPTRRTG